VTLLLLPPSDSEIDREIDRLRVDISDCIRDTEKDVGSGYSMPPIISNSYELGLSEAKRVINSRPSYMAKAAITIPINKRHLTLGMVERLIGPTVTHLNQWTEAKSRLLLRFSSLILRSRELNERTRNLLRTDSLDSARRKRNSLNDEAGPSEAAFELTEYRAVRNEVKNNVILTEFGRSPKYGWFAYLSFALGLFLGDGILNFYILKGYLGKSEVFGALFALAVAVMFGIAAHLAGGILKEGVTEQAPRRLNTDDDGEEEEAAEEEDVRELREKVSSSLEPYAFTIKRLFQPFDFPRAFAISMLASGVLFLVLPRIGNPVDRFFNFIKSFTAENSPKVDPVLAALQSVTGDPQLPGADLPQDYFWLLMVFNFIVVVTAIYNSFLYHDSYPSRHRLQEKLKLAKQRLDRASTQAKSRLELLERRQNSETMMNTSRQLTLQELLELLQSKKKSG